MPDNNKIKTFQEAGVCIARTCVTCQHSRWGRGGSDWGNCVLRTYEHKKHGKRPMPANIAFVCPEWEKRQRMWEAGEMGKYVDLLKMEGE